MKHRLAFLFLAVSLTHCGPGSVAHEEPQSMLHFIPFSTTRGISLRYARESVFKVCTQGASNSEVEQWSIRAVLTWLKASRKVDDQVTREVAISCQNAHLNINMRGGNGVSFASPGNANFYTGKPFGELVHELGHALAGLGDTYVGRQAGSCRSGHPQSNMCWGAYGPRANPENYSGLWPDDILGVHAQHKKLFPDATPPLNAEVIDAEAPVDASNPWPEEGDNGRIDDGTDNVKQVFVALAESTTDAARLYLSVPKGTQSAVVCANIAELNACLASPAKIAVQSAGTLQDRILFATSGEIAISAGQNFYAFALEGNGQPLAQRTFQFQAAN